MTQATFCGVMAHEGSNIVLKYFIKLIKFKFIKGSLQRVVATGRD